MRNTKYIIATLLLIVTAGFFIFEHQVRPEQKNDLEKSELKSNQKPQTKIVQNQFKKTDKQQEQNKDSIEPVYATFFHDDAVLDREIISQKYKHCSALLFILKNNTKMDLRYKKLKTNRPNYFKKQLENCQKINLEHPDYYLENQNKISLSANSYLGRVYFDQDFAFSEFENNSEALQKAFINADPNLMLSFYAEMAYLSFIPDLRLILGSQQNDYGLIIGNYARKLFACRLGADCGENSAIVFNTCLNNEYLCTNSIEELIKTKFSKGQQADIELAVQYLSTVYKTDE